MGEEPDEGVSGRRGGGDELDEGGGAVEGGEQRAEGGGCGRNLTGGGADEVDEREGDVFVAGVFVDWFEAGGAFGVRVSVSGRARVVGSLGRG